MAVEVSAKSIKVQILPLKPKVKQACARQALQQNVDLAKQLGFLRAPLDVGKYADLTIAKDAGKRLDGAANHYPVNPTILPGTALRASFFPLAG